MIGFMRNNRSFSEICQNSYGRAVIYTGASKINQSNIVEELGKALSIHWKNRQEIDYLERYYKGDQPIKYRIKQARPEINNTVVENHAFEFVEHKTAENFGEPVQYVLVSDDESTKEAKSKEVNQFNRYMDISNKQEVDVAMARDRSICGTSYRFNYNNDDFTVDEAPFGIDREDPKETFVVYSSGNGKKPIFSCQIRKDEENKQYYFIYTNNQTFIIKNSEITSVGINGIGYIPVVEYPNNSYRLSDIEIVIDSFDAMNKMQSDRMNGIEQFIQSFIKFINCEIDGEAYQKMREECCLIVKTTNPQCKADVQIMDSQLDQAQSQIAKDDLYDNALKISGIPDRKENSGGDTGQAVVMRNGYYFSEKRAEITEPIYKKSERQSLKVILSMMRTREMTSLVLQDLEIKITRSKMDNMMVKTQVLQILLSLGLDPKVAIKTCNLFSDSEEVYSESKEYLAAKYLTKAEMESQTTDNKLETDTKVESVIETVN